MHVVSVGMQPCMDALVKIVNHLWYVMHSKIGITSAKPLKS